MAYVFSLYYKIAKLPHVTHEQFFFNKTFKKMNIASGFAPGFTHIFLSVWESAFVCPFSKILFVLPFLHLSDSYFDVIVCLTPVLPVFVQYYSGEGRSF